MTRPVSSWMLGLSAGATVFAIVIPPTHLLAELIQVVGLELGGWGNPAGVFLFLISTMAVGVFPWGLWIALTDARSEKAFDDDRGAYHYIVAATGSFVILAILSVTRLQSVYKEFRWFLTPALLVCAITLVRWRWNYVWEFPTKVGMRGIVAHALGADETY